MSEKKQMNEGCKFQGVKELESRLVLRSDHKREDYDSSMYADYEHHLSAKFSGSISLDFDQSDPKLCLIEWDIDYFFNNTSGEMYRDKFNITTHQDTQIIKITHESTTEKEVKFRVIVKCESVTLKGRRERDHKREEEYTRSKKFEKFKKIANEEIRLENGHFELLIIKEQQENEKVYKAKIPEMLYGFRVLEWHKSSYWGVKVGDIWFSSEFSKKEGQWMEKKYVDGKYVTIQ